MKRIFYFSISFIISVTVLYNIGYITDNLANLLKHQPSIIISKPNLYYKSNDYKFVQENSDFIPYSKQDLKNIFFSILNNGYEKFTFYCPSVYSECINDVHDISSDSNQLTHINNFISPYNNFNNIRVTYNESGEINIEVKLSYSVFEIEEINTKVDLILNEVITDTMMVEDKVLALHDHIINITKHDQKRPDGDLTYKSNIAYGPLIEGYAICGGYADAMALFLNKLEIPNFKVSSSTHVWNAVYINEKWLHLDLTWDDPVSKYSNNDNLIHKFYLIDTDTLESYDIDYHEFDKIIYRELLN